PLPDPRKPAERDHDFLAYREKYRDISSFPANFGKAVPKSPMILGGSSKIPYAGEQRNFSAEQGINVPCSAENTEISRLMHGPPLVRLGFGLEDLAQGSEKPKSAPKLSCRSCSRGNLGLLAAAWRSRFRRGPPGTPARRPCRPCRRPRHCGRARGYRAPPRSASARRACAHRPPRRRASRPPPASARRCARLR